MPRWFRRKQRVAELAPEQAAAPDSRSPDPPPGEGNGRTVSEEEEREQPGRVTPPRRRRSRAGQQAGKGTGSTEATPEKPAAPRTRRRTQTPRRPTLPSVRKEMLISHDVGEQRVAILEDGQPVEVYLERPGRRSIAGNVYKGTVDNVLPGMEASFVDIGLEKDGFLYVDEIVVPELEGKRRDRRIQDLISKGEEVLVQAVKDPMGTKGARLTTEISLPGRFLVYTPFGDGVGVSRRLEDEERERLKAICKSLELVEGGVIVRTAAEGASQEELEADLALLVKLWATIRGRAARAKAPALVYAEAELPLRVVRDLFRSDFDRLAVDHERTYRRIVSYLKRTSRELADRVERYRDAEPIMERFGVDAAVRSTLERRVDLPSGGYLIFDYAEAFTVIDVNTGRFVGARGKAAGPGRLEETITKNNLEAAKEIVRQLRLRDVGGIIVIDFIDMANPKNRHDVEEALKLELERDRTKTYVVEISPLGLVEMTRQNVTDGPREILTRRCPVCEGDGIVVSEETYAVDAERTLRRLVASSSAEAFIVELPTEVARILIGPAGSRLAEIERETGRRFAFETRDDLAADHISVIAEGSSEEIEPKALPVREGDELEVQLEEVHLHHRTDAIARLDGYVVAVAGAASLVGQTVRVRIGRATRTVGYATLASAAATEGPVEVGALAEEEDGAVEAPKRKTRRGTRGGQSRKKPAGETMEAGPTDATEEVGEAPQETPAAAEEAPAPSATRTQRPARRGAGTQSGRSARSTAAKTKAETPAVEEPAAAGGEAEPEEPSIEPGAEDGSAADVKPKRKTRRGTRGGRGRKKAPAAEQLPGDGAAEAQPGGGQAAAAAVSPEPPTGDASGNGAQPDEQPPRKRTRRGTRGGKGRRKAPVGTSEAVPDQVAAAADGG